MRNDEADAKAQEKMEMAEIVGEVDEKIKKINGMRKLANVSATKNCSNASG